MLRLFKVKIPTVAVIMILISQYMKWAKHI